MLYLLAALAVVSAIIWGWLAGNAYARIMLFVCGMVGLVVIVGLVAEANAMNAGAAIAVLGACGAGMFGIAMLPSLFKR